MQLHNRFAKLKWYRLILVVFYIYFDAVHLFGDHWNIVWCVVQFFNHVTMQTFDVNIS